MSRPNPPPRITVSEVKEALDELGIALERSAAKQVSASKSKRRAAIAIGALSIAMAGAVLAIVYSSDSIDALGGVTAVLSVIAAVFAVWVAAAQANWARRQADSAHELALRAAEELQVIEGWAELEAAMRNRVGERLGGDRLSLPVVIEEYADSANLSDEEVEELRSILRLRNEAAHSPTGFFANSEAISEVLPALRRHLEKARKELPRSPRAYESLALANLQLVAPGVAAVETGSGDSGVDAVLRTDDDRLINVIVKYTSRGGTLSRSAMKTIRGHSRNRFVPTLVITNYKIPEDMQVSLWDTYGVSGEAVRVVHWAGPEDNDRLKAVTSEMLSKG
ncbi:hypothetical protein [Thermomonospora cellulosilytica]|uniref:F0F1-type ATP synthase assembly protein I n=1 Tax=Thermomonospora cellulosilytica TaxID=1411118 RepID=A0A7W3MUB8_9ACTN|nr:hypothetical protein [Thermomonospora cellulosilytica]MBA9002067.1 F0F1-type ATP synthase assembly protein I [Thermomonospora cellulosilytica]